MHKETNPRYHALISKFKERTGCPVVINTSFNVRDEPIVCSWRDALACFMPLNWKIKAAAAGLLIHMGLDAVDCLFM